MNGLYVEASEKYSHGFVLSEQELRRSVEVCQEQLTKDNSRAEINTLYTLKYGNGAVAETDDIEAIIKEDNSGSALIVSLKVKLEDNLERSIEFEFTNIDRRGEGSSDSVKYKVRGNSRDWVFVSSSLIEERLKKCKRFSFNASRKGYRFFSLIILSIFTIAPMILSLTIGSSKKEQVLSEVKTSWQEGDLTDPVEAIIILEEARANMESLDPFLYVLIGLVSLIVLSVMVYFYLKWLFPIHNFCWGDYQAVFEKKENARKVVNVVIVLGLIISTVGGIIANSLGKF